MAKCDKMAKCEKPTRNDVNTIFRTILALCKQSPVDLKLNVFFQDGFVQHTIIVLIMWCSKKWPDSKTPSFRST